MTTSEQPRRAAWDAIQSKLVGDQLRVLNVIRNNGDRGLTDAEIFNRFTTTAMATVVGRRNELVKLGLIRNVGKRRNPYTKYMATVWVAVRQGELFPPATQADRREG